MYETNDTGPYICVKTVEGKQTKVNNTQGKIIQVKHYFP